MVLCPEKCPEILQFPWPEKITVPTAHAAVYCFICSITVSVLIHSISEFRYHYVLLTCILQFCLCLANSVMTVALYTMLN